MHTLRTGHLFAGAGGGILADLLLGHQPIFAVEIEDYPRKVLEQRQADKILPFFPIFGDIKEFDGKPWRGTVDVLCGGFPCQDISSAGKGAGITGERSGLWKEYARLIDEIRPSFVFAENSPLLRTRGLGVVLEDLAAMGYDARWGIMGAWHVGAPHKRDRMWVLAYAKGSSIDGKRRKSKIEKQEKRAEFNGCRADETMAYPNNQRLQGIECSRRADSQGRQESHGSIAKRSGLWWHTDPADLDDTSVAGLERTERIANEDESAGTTKSFVGRVADELADSLDIIGASFYGRIPRVADGNKNRVHRIKAIGNGQVPLCAAIAFSILSEGLI